MSEAERTPTRGAKLFSALMGGIFFLIFGFVHSFFYACNRIDIFDWHPDNENNKRALLREKRQILKAEKGDDKPPLAWKTDRFLHIFLGILTGWILLWVLLDKRINIFHDPNFNNLGLADLTLFLLGWIGINGRLASIAHLIGDLMKSGLVLRNRSL